MVSTPPDPIDIVDFQFKEQCRLKVFESDKSFPNACNLVTVASRFGLIFVGTKRNELQVIQVKDIEDCNKEISNFKRRIVELPSPTLHISVNCNCTRLAVVIIKENCPHAIFYDVLSFLKQDIKVINHTKLSSSPTCKVLAIDWNPALPDVFTACKDDGTLLVYEFKGSPIELPAAAGVTCFCWSPKGKQLAVGSRDGKITQYKIDLKAVKVTEAPPGFKSIMSLCWLSSFQFMGMYEDIAGEQNSLICVDAPKTGATVYTSYDDVCYSNGNVRPTQFYLIHQQHWNVLFVASSNSMEIGILGLGDTGKWTQWLLNDNSRASLPLAGKSTDTLPIGATFNVGAMKCLIGNDTKLTPSLLVLSDHGMLCVFHAINERPGAMDICQMLENISDRSGEKFFTSTQATSTQQLPQAVSIKQQLPTPVIPTVPPVVLPVAPITQTAVLPKPIASFSAIPNVPGLSINPIAPTPPAPAATILKTPEPQLQINKTPALNINAKPFHMPPQPQPTAVSTPLQVEKPATTPEAKPTNVTIPKPQLKANEKLPVTDETENMIANLVREECHSLESELKEILKGINTQMKIGTDSEMSQISKKVLDLEEFYQAIKENINTHDSEVYTLKQNLLQTWACFEEARTRFASSKDPLTKVLMQSMPLDPASQHQLDEINRMMYYIDSQLSQANQCLDEQWDAFQDALMKSDKLKMPTMESIYQSMVQHSKILQKQKYLLKHIASRVNSTKRAQCNSLLNIEHYNSDALLDLQNELSRLQIHPVPLQYNKLVERQSKLNSTKSKKIYDLFTKREVSRIYNTKPQLNNSTIQLSTLLAAPLSPIGKKLGNKLEHQLINSTPKPVQEFKVQKVPTQTYSPLAQQQFGMMQKQEASSKQQIPANLFGSSSASSLSGGFTISETHRLLQSRPLSVSSSISSMIPVPGPGNTSPVIKPVATAASNALGFNLSIASGPVTTSSFSFGLSSVGKEPTTTGVSVLFKAPAGIAATTTSEEWKYPTTTLQDKFCFAGVSSTATSAMSPTTGRFNFPAVKPTTEVTTSGTGGSLFKPALLETPVASTPTTGNSNAKPALLTSAPSNIPLQSPFGMVASTTSNISFTTTTTTSTSIFAQAAKTFSPSAGLFTTTTTQSVSATSPLISMTSTTTATTEVSRNLFGSSGTSIFAVKPSTSSVFNVPSNATIFGGAASSNSSTSLATTGTTVSDSKSVFSFATSVFGSITPSSTPTPSGIFGGTGNVIGTKATTTLSSVAVTSASVLPTTTSKTSSSVTTTTAIVTSSVPTTTGTLSPVTTTLPLSTAAATAPTSTSGFVSSSIVAQPATPTTISTSAFSTSTTVAAPAPTTTSIFASALSSVKSPTSAFGAAATSTPATTSTFGTGSIFASAASAFGTSSNFAGTPTTTTTTTASSIFGSNAFATAAPSSPLSAFPTFGQTTTATTSPFGQATTTTTSAFGQTTTAASPFAQGTTTVASPFAQPTTAATSPFAQPTTAATSPFAQVTTTAASPFVQATTTVASPFAQAITTVASPFAQAATTAPSPFAQAATTTPSPFAQATTTTASPFGQATTTSTTSAFGQTTTTNSIFGQTKTPNVFGQTTVSPFGQTATTTSPFGTSTSTIVSKAFSGGSLFAQPTEFNSNTQGSIFGGGTNANTGSSVFGQAAVSSTTNSPFGGSSAFSSTPFGASTPATTASVFGNSNFGTSSFGSPNASAFANPPNTQSSSTFSSFGNLNVGGNNNSAFGQSTPAANPFGRGIDPQRGVFGGTSNNLFSSSSNPQAGTFASGNNNSFGSNTFGQQSTFGSSFGTASNAPGAFSSVTGQSVQQTGFGSPSFQKPAFGSAPVFGQSTTFGGNASFGASPTFGGGATFGSPQKVFGTGTEPTSGGFGAAANAQSSTFGSLANQNTVGFGNLAQQATQSQPLPFSGGSSFTNWRN